MKNDRSAQSLAILFGGETLQLLAQRAVWWKAQAVLFIADVHLGKQAAFRAASIPVPDSTAADLARLSDLIHSTRCERLVVLGDLVHSRQGLTPTLVEQFTTWRNQHNELNVVLLMGNHDRRVGEISSQWRLSIVEQPAEIQPFTLRHEPIFNKSVPTLAGHTHPKVRVSLGADEVRLPCFVQQKNTLVLPAFGSFVDGMLIPHRRGKVFAIAEDEVIEI